MAYRIAGIDVHKRMLTVVVCDVEGASECEFERGQYGSTPGQLRLLAAWLVEQQVEEVVMESTAQYGKPVWATLEQYWKPLRQGREGAGPMSGTLHLAQAQSNRGPRGRKNDFADPERLVKRLVAGELILSFVPSAEQHLWRTLMRSKYQLRCNQVQLQNRLEALLEEAHLKLSSLVSDLLGLSGRRMLTAIAEGETDPTVVAARADYRLRATPEQLCDALPRRLWRTPSRLPPIVEGGVGGVATNRGPNSPTRPRDGHAAGCPSGAGPATGGSARPRGRFRAADHRGGGRLGSDFPFCQSSLLLGGRMSRRGGERGGEPQSPVPEG